MENRRPALFHGVPARPSIFVGRDEVVASLVERLISGNTMAISANGMPGVGKTSLAAVLAHHPAVLNHFGDGVLWGALGPNADSTPVLAGWAEALSMEIAGLADPPAALRNWIGQRKMLVVIDDAWDLDAAEALRCGGPLCCHLLTTRDEELARRFAGPPRVESIQELTEDAAWELLRELAPETCAAHPAGARALVRAVGGLPLAVELLGGYLAAPIRRYFADTAADGVEELGDPRRRVQLAAKRLGARQQGAVTLAATVELSIHALPPDAATTFYALGAFAPKPETFDRAAAEAVTGATPLTLGLLLGRKLLEQPEPNVLAIHQVLSDVAREKTPKDAFERHRDYYLGEVEASGADWRRVERIYAQVQWGWERLSDSAGLARLGFVWAVGPYQRRRGLWSEGIAWREAALEEARRLGLARSCAVLVNDLGWLHDNMGEQAKALEYYQQARAITLELGDRPGTAVALNNIAQTYNALGDRKKALEYYEQALPIVEELDRTGLAVTLANMGALHHSLGDPRKALKYFGQARLIQEETGDHQGLAATLSNMGTVYNELYQRQKALDSFAQALRINEEAGDRYGELVTRYNLAQLHRGEGRLGDAKSELRRVVELAERIQSPDLEAYQQLLQQVADEWAQLPSSMTRNR